jgi:hypothetical protein
MTLIGVNGIQPRERLVAVWLNTPGGARKDERNSHRPLASPRVIHEIAFEEQGRQKPRRYRMRRYFGAWSGHISLFVTE